MKITIDKAIQQCDILKHSSIKNELFSYLKEYKLINIEKINDEYMCTMFNSLGFRIELILSSSTFRINIYKSEVIERVVIDEDKVLSKYVLEKRENGIVYSEIKKKFGESSRYRYDTVLLDLEEIRYVFDKSTLKEISNNINYEEISPNDLFYIIRQFSLHNKLSDYANLINTFRSHMNYYYNIGGRNLKVYPYSNITYLNEEDISGLYDIVDGSNKISRIYDLYSGIINEDNEEDIISINLGLINPLAFDLQKSKGIKESESSIVGPSYTFLSSEYIDYIKEFLYDKFGYVLESEKEINSIIKSVLMKHHHIEVDRKIHFERPELTRKLSLKNKLFAINLKKRRCV